MNKNKEEMLPKIVEDKMQEAYRQIRKGETERMKRRNYPCHRNTFFCLCGSRLFSKNGTPE